VYKNKVVRNTIKSFRIFISFAYYLETNSLYFVDKRVPLIYISSISMSALSKRIEENYTSTRVTIRTSLPYDEVVSRLDCSVGRFEASSWSKITQYLRGPEPTKEGFISMAKAAIGPQQFMIFWEIEHSLWTPLYGIAPSRRIKRVIVGNPMSAASVMAYSLKAGLAAPAELLILEGENSSGTEVVFQLFSALASRIENGEALENASLNLDDKVQGLVDYITS